MNVLARAPSRAYIFRRTGNFPSRRSYRLSQTGLQKLAFFLLVALILYVSVTGGA